MRLSGRTVAIKTVPTDLPAGETRNLFAEVLDSIELDKRGGAKATFRDDIAASLACKAAIKINMKLTPEKMHWLVDRLLEKLADHVSAWPTGHPKAVDEGHRAQLSSHLTYEPFGQRTRIRRALLAAHLYSRDRQHVRRRHGALGVFRYFAN